MHSTLGYVSPINHELLAVAHREAASSTCPPNGGKIREQEKGVHVVCRAPKKNGVVLRRVGQRA